MKTAVRLLDVVALTKNDPAHGLCRGQVGTVVEVLDPETFEIEFSDNRGRSYALLPLRASQLMVLHHQRVKSASSA